MDNLLKVIDLHCDTFDRLAYDYETGWNKTGAHRPQTLKHNDKALNLEEMKDFRWLQCFAIFIPERFQNQEALDFYLRVKDRYDLEFSDFSSEIQQIRSISELDSVWESGKAASFLTIENGTVLNAQISTIDILQEHGVKMLTLTWNGKNAIGSGNDTTDGLTTFGREAIKALEEANIIIDLSHLNEHGYDDAFEVMDKPMVASHSNLRAVCDHPRNLQDEQVLRLIDMGGIFGLNFCRDFISTKHADPDFDDISYHIDHAIKLGAEDHLCLGTDYDGAKVPSFLSAGSKLQGFYELLENRFGQEISAKLFYKNAQRFFNEYEAS